MRIARASPQRCARVRSQGETPLTAQRLTWGNCFFLQRCISSSADRAQQAAPVRIERSVVRRNSPNGRQAGNEAYRRPVPRAGGSVGCRPGWVHQHALCSAPGRWDGRGGALRGARKGGGQCARACLLVGVGVYAPATPSQANPPYRSKPTLREAPSRASPRRRRHRRSRGCSSPPPPQLLAAVQCSLSFPS